MKLISLGPSQPEKRSDRLNNPAIPLSSVADWMWLGGGAETDAAELVNTATALQLSTVFTCVKILAKSVSSLPLQLFSKTPTGKILDTAHPLSYLLGQEPNPEMDIRSETVNRLPGGCSIVDPNIEGVNRHLSCK